MQQRQVDVAADYRDVVCNRVLSGGGGRDRPFGGFDGAVRPQLASLRLAMSLKPDRHAQVQFGEERVQEVGQALGAP